MICQRLGCTSISGLSGDVAIPRQKKPATAESLGEKDELGDSNAEFEQLPAAPHRVAPRRPTPSNWFSSPHLMSRISSGVIVRTVVGLRHDYLLLNGSGADSEPTGILQSSAVGKTTFGGAVSYQQLVDMETALGLANADEGRLAYATTPPPKES